ncbi:hypothetical protein HCUR_00036 [Holospora curviuscula]|uniref:Uncharacterized protein n=2 Tax=Holospora curviuscula TaxID=1082868 RepID=A0A2S5RHY9_9PROT|nr:hypothetical protein HCUR_00036 [Holospora curviuscula]
MQSFASSYPQKLGKSSFPAPQTNKGINQSSISYSQKKATPQWYSSEIFSLMQDLSALNIPVDYFGTPLPSQDQNFYVAVNKLINRIGALINTNLSLLENSEKLNILLQLKHSFERNNTNNFMKALKKVFDSVNKMPPKQPKEHAKFSNFSSPRASKHTI